MNKAISTIVISILVFVAFYAAPKVFALLLIVSIVVWMVSFIKWVMK